MPWREKNLVGVTAGREGFSRNNSKMSESFILVWLLRMYFPRNWEFGSALSKLRNFGGGLKTPTPLPPPSVRHCTKPGLRLSVTEYRGADKSLARPGRKQATARQFLCSYILFIIIIGEILLLFIYTTRLASKKIFSPSNKINREVGRAKDLSAPRYFVKCHPNFPIALFLMTIMTIIS